MQNSLEQLFASVVHSSMTNGTQNGFTTLFLDLNSYFASVEQQLRPELRGVPVAVVPVDTDSTCCIAASYEAKALGIRTGTNVGEAKRICRDLKIVESRPDVYVRVHHQIVAAVESCVPVEKVYSIDEMLCKLTGRQREPHNALELAHRIKATIYGQIGEFMRCSIGLSTNRLLAKLATDMQKPDGLVTIALSDLPEKLYSLRLIELPGIGRKMEARLNNKGVSTVQQLCGKTEQEMRDLWGGIVGVRWWHWLRGDDIYEAPTQRGSVGHEHVLPPSDRNDTNARAILVRLIHKAAARIRSLDDRAGRMTVRVEHKGRSDWSVSRPLSSGSDTLEMLALFAAVWAERPNGIPYKVGVTLSDLKPSGTVAESLFPTDQKRDRLSKAMDSLNSKYGKHTIYPGGMHMSKDSAPTRIAFSSIPDPDLPE